MNHPAAPPPSSSTIVPSSRHLVFLDCLRALAALYVLVHHTYSLSTEYHFFDGVPSAVQRIAGVFTAGHLAVDLFIVLSGFSLMLAVLRTDQAAAFWPFLSRRAQRILPPYYAALALPLLLHFATGGYLLSAPELTAWPIVAHLLLLQDCFADTWSAINNILWSVSVEWRLYLLFPVFSYLYLRFGLRALLGIATLVFVGAVVFCQSLHLTQVYEWTGICPQYVLLFAFGMSCAILRFSDKPRYASLRQRIERLPASWFWTLFLVAFTLFFLKGGSLWKPLGPSAIFLYDVIVGLFAALLLLRVSYPSASVASRNLFQNTRLAGIGLMAYSLYLVHYPVLQLCANLARDYVPTNPLRLTLMFTVGIASAYGIACGFYRFIERPFALPKKKALPG